MNKLHIVTVGTEKKGYYNILIESCKRLNLNIVNLGLNKKWTGLTMKFDLFEKYLNKLDDNDIVLFTDAYDVFFLEDEKTILNKFYKFKKPIVFGNQSGILTDLFMIECKKNNNLNTGSYIGYVKYLKKLLKITHDPKLYRKFNGDDQLLLNHVCKSSKFFEKYVAVDTNNDIFYITNLDTYVNYKYLLNKDIGLTEKNNKLLKKKDNKQPSVIHLAASINGRRYVEYLKYNKEHILEINNGFKIKQCKSYLTLLIKKYNGQLIIFILFLLLLRHKLKNS